MPVSLRGTAHHLFPDKCGVRAARTFAGMRTPGPGAAPHERPLLAPTRALASGPPEPPSSGAPLLLLLGRARGGGQSPYRHCLGPSDGLCAGLRARLLWVGLCWCVQGHAVLWGHRGLARVVLRGVRRGRGVLSGDAVLRRWGVLGRGVGLGHRFRRSRGVLIALWGESKAWLVLSGPRASGTVTFS